VGTVAGASRCGIVSGETARFFQFSIMIEPACNDFLKTRIMFVVYTPFIAKWMWRDFLLKRFRSLPSPLDPFSTQFRLKILGYSLLLMIAHRQTVHVEQPADSLNDWFQD
jgi:hypothetical protein